MKIVGFNPAYYWLGNVWFSACTAWEGLWENKDEISGLYRDTIRASVQGNRLVTFHSPIAPFMHVCGIASFSILLN